MDRYARKIEYKIGEQKSYITADDIYLYFNDSLTFRIFEKLDRSGQQDEYTDNNANPDEIRLKNRPLVETNSNLPLVTILI